MMEAEAEKALEGSTCIPVTPEAVRSAPAVEDSAERAGKTGGEGTTSDFALSDDGTPKAVRKCNLHFNTEKLSANTLRTHSSSASTSASPSDAKRYAPSALRAGRNLLIHVGERLSSASQSMTSLLPSGLAAKVRQQIDGEVPFQAVRGSSFSEGRGGTGEERRDDERWSLVLLEARRERAWWQLFIITIAASLLSALVYSFGLLSSVLSSNGFSPSQVDLLFGCGVAGQYFALTAGLLHDLKSPLATSLYACFSTAVGFSLFIVVLARHLCFENDPSERSGTGGMYGASGDLFPASLISSLDSQLVMGFGGPKCNVSSPPLASSYEVAILGFSLFLAAQGACSISYATLPTLLAQTSEIRRGLVSALLASGFGLSAFVLSSVFEAFFTPAVTVRSPSPEKAAPLAQRPFIVAFLAILGVVLFGLTMMVHIALRRVGTLQTCLHLRAANANRPKTSLIEMNESLTGDRDDSLRDGCLKDGSLDTDLKRPATRMNSRDPEGLEEGSEAHSHNSGSNHRRQGIAQENLPFPKGTTEGEELRRTSAPNPHTSSPDPQSTSSASPIRGFGRLVRRARKFTRRRLTSLHVKLRNIWKGDRSQETAKFLTSSRGQKYVMHCVSQSLVQASIAAVVGNIQYLSIAHRVPAKFSIAYLVKWLSIANFLGRVLSGVVSQKLSADRYVYFFMFSAAAAAIGHAIFLFSAPVASPTLFVVLIVFMAAALGSNFAVGPVWVMQRISMTHMATLQSILMVFVASCTFLFSMLAGREIESEADRLHQGAQCYGATCLRTWHLSLTLLLVLAFILTCFQRI